ncbi:WNT1-inducible-signaling pathway protein 1 [Fukomys damarensis]|uniref:CCN family member 4 n=1 Tax=Fukomys damarensis TaxID=885580 RepID=A0A091DL05_FUKDA|nr:WNT1-inducible-signaling pathway protein 1 [Fukomys damarensis]
MWCFLSWALAAVTAAAAGSILATALPPALETMGVTPTPPEDTASHLEFCKWPCECPPSLPRCPLGVSLVTDGCECCKICAQQLGDNCTEAAICDPHRGLYCDYSRDRPRYAIGVCAPLHQDDQQQPQHGACTLSGVASEVTAPCWALVSHMKSVLYSTKKHNSVIPSDYYLLSTCFVPKVVGVGCVLDGVRYSNGESFQPSCRYKCTCIGGVVGCTPLCLRARPPRLWCSQPRRVKVPGQCCEQWVCEDDARRPRQTMLGDTAAPAAVSDVEPWHGNCLPYTSPWSPCSTSCGLGISTRVSNTNAQCWPEQESRLCNLRPCDVDIRPHIKEGKKCLAVFQPDAPMNFTLAGCVSTHSYRPKYCGVCTDNRCCIPYKSKTIEVSFQCPEGPGFSRKVLWINACFCNLTCRNPNDIFADLELYPDISEIAN